MKLINLVIIVCFLNIVKTYAQDVDVIDLYKKIDINKVDASVLWIQHCNQGITNSSSSKFCSKNIEHFFRIFNKYSPLSTENCYLLKDTVNNNYIYDVDFKKGKYVVNHKYKKEIKEIYESYGSWITLVKEKGISKVQSDKIGPLDHTKYKWVLIR